MANNYEAEYQARSFLAQACRASRNGATELEKLYQGYRHFASGNECQSQLTLDQFVAVVLAAFPNAEHQRRSVDNRAGQARFIVGISLVG